MPATPDGFAKRIDRLRADLVEQGRRVQALLEAAFDALFSRDVGRAARITGMDDVIDRADVEIERALVQLLADATRQGAHLEVAQLRLVLTMSKVNNELERMADAGVDIAELLPQLHGASSPFPDTFRVMANSVIGIVRDANSSMYTSDPLLANVVLQSQHAVTAFKNALLRDAEEHVATGRMTVDFAFLLHELASICEIVADHCTNVAEQVIYGSTGAIVRHTDAQWVEVGRRAAEG